MKIKVKMLLLEHFNEAFDIMEDSVSRMVYKQTEIRLPWQIQPQDQVDQIEPDT